MTHKGLFDEIEESLRLSVLNADAANRRDDLKSTLDVLTRFREFRKDVPDDVTQKIEQGYAQFDAFGTCHAVLYSEGEEPVLNNIVTAVTLLAQAQEKLK